MSFYLKYVIISHFHPVLKSSLTISEILAYFILLSSFLKLKIVDLLELISFGLMIEASRLLLYLFKTHNLFFFSLFVSNTYILGETWD